MKLLLEDQEFKTLQIVKLWYFKKIRNIKKEHMHNY